MTFKRASRAAELRGFILHPKAWCNNMVGYGYELWADFNLCNDGNVYYRHICADTLDGVYREIMRYPRIEG